MLSRILLASTVLLSTLSIPLNPKKVVIAINCGTSSVSLPAQDGYRYQADNRYV
jgi:hypothetical protein